MKRKPLIHRNFLRATAVAGVLIGLCGSPSRCLANPPDLSPDLQEVVTLSQQHMSDQVITSFIQNSGKVYRLRADDIIYLSNQGVSQNVILALEQSISATPTSPTVPVPPAAPAPMPPPVAPSAPSFDQAPPTVPAPPTAEVNFQYFHDQLAPWGTWIQLPGYGPVWKPSDAVLSASPDWRPYYDNGQWVDTDNGLYWQSDYTWGNIPFHYGRWLQDPYQGWVWVPDYTWGPSWVAWRHAEADGVIGWAALPPGAVFLDGAFRFHGIRVGVDCDFGLGENCFVFVDGDHFHERFLRLRGHEWRYHIDDARRHELFRRSVIRVEFHTDAHGRLVNYGIGRDRMEHVAPRMEHGGVEDRHPGPDRPNGDFHGDVHGGAPHSDNGGRSSHSDSEHQH